MTYRIYLGGSFDPVHRSHLQMAMAVHAQLSAKLSAKLGTDDITLYLLPTAGNPFKGTPTASTHRLSMLSLATQDLPIGVDDYELTCSPPIYTIDTIAHLHTIYPDDVLIFVIGFDSLLSLPKWRGGEMLADQVKFWAFSRVGETDTPSDTVMARCTTDLDEFLVSDGKIYLDDTPIQAMSSSHIRQLICDGKTDALADYLHPAIIDYIHTHQLYQDG